MCGNGKNYIIRDNSEVLALSVNYLSDVTFKGYACTYDTANARFLAELRGYYF